MTNTEFELKQFNNDLGNMISSQCLNFANVILAEQKAKISVTASFAPTLTGNEYCTLDSNLDPIIKTDMNSFYYGVSPLLDSHKIIEAISQMRFSTLNGIDDFICENAELFMLHKSQEMYLRSFARHLVIAFSSNYGIRLQFPDEFDIKSEIIDKFKEKCHFTVPDNNDGNIKGCCTLHNDNSNNILCLNGCPPEEMIKILDEYRFVNKTIKDKKSGETITVWSYICTEEKSEKNIYGIKEIYGIPGSVILLNGLVLYSGVLFKPLKVEKKSADFQNDGIVSVVIHFERSTYAVVYSIDNEFTQHPLLDNTTREEMNCFFKENDKQKSALIDNINKADKDSIFDVVTTYLTNSYNVNQIGISGTVITKDGISVFSQRNAKAIDAGSVYPGVNGNAELFDNDVSFYKESVYEDAPTVRISDDRMDFQGEICREAYAELACPFDEQMCICRGIVLSGNKPTHASCDCNHTDEHRRMHLNILFEQQCNKTFDELLIGYKKASEAFENQNLLGLRIKCYNNFLHCIERNIIEAFKFILKFKNFFESLLVLIVFCSTMIGVNSGASLSVKSVLSSILAAIVLAVNISQGYTAIKSISNRKKHIRNAVVFKNTKSDKMSVIARRFLKGYEYHPVTAAITKLHIENTVYNAFGN